MEKFREIDSGRSRVVWNVKRTQYKCSKCGQPTKLINPRTQMCPKCEHAEKEPAIVQPKKEVSESGREIDW